MLLTIADLAGRDGLVHGFSTSAEGSVARRHEGWEAARARLAAAAGLGGTPIVTMGAVHGAEVAVVDGPPDLVHGVDALVTGRRGLALFATFADCYPILLHDPARGAIGLAHAGWRGTASGVGPAAVAAMVAEFGCRPEDMLAGIGPGICGRCYEVGEEVAAHFPDAVLAPSPAGRHLLDLAAANRIGLEGAGIPAERIFTSGICTFETSHLPSHRRHPDGTRFGGLVALAR